MAVLTNINAVLDLDERALSQTSLFSSVVESADLAAAGTLVVVVQAPAGKTVVIRSVEFESTCDPLNVKCMTATGLTGGSGATVSNHDLSPGVTTAKPVVTTNPTSAPDGTTLFNWTVRAVDIQTSLKQAAWTKELNYAVPAGQFFKFVLTNNGTAAGDIQLYMDFVVV